MSRTHGTSDSIAAQATQKGCGCGGRSRQTSPAKLSADGQTQPEPPARGAGPDAKDAAGHAGCCCGESKGGDAVAVLNPLIGINALVG
jgi:hypothetical protein